jgi:hypothetical protein
MSGYLQYESSSFMHFSILSFGSKTFVVIIIRGLIHFWSSLTILQSYGYLQDLAHGTGLKPGVLHTFGALHIYTNIGARQAELTREPYPLPR